MSNPELLAPVGNEEGLKAAVQAGCDAVYLGGNRLNARMAAQNFSDDQLKAAIRYAKLRRVKVYLTLNTLVFPQEMDGAVRAARQAEDWGADGLIVQDLGLAARVQACTRLPLHASTQCSIHNIAGVQAMERLGFDRVILAREMNMAQIAQVCQNTKLEMEVFVHGALCASLSGQCLYSWLKGGRSGNRGKCAQPCRLPGENGGYPLSTRDCMAMDQLPELIAAGVRSFKLEGRLKRPEYVSVVVTAYRKALDLALAQGEWDTRNYQEQLMKIYNRGGFTAGYLTGKRDIFGASTPNHRGEYIGKVTGYQGGKMTVQTQKTVHVYDGLSFGNKGIGMEISDLYQGGLRQTEAAGEVTFSSALKGAAVGDAVYRTSDKRQLDWARAQRQQELPKRLLDGHCVLNQAGASLAVELDGRQVIAQADQPPVLAQHRPVTAEEVTQSLRKTGDTVFAFANLSIDLEDGLYISKKELNALRRKAVALLENELLKPSVRWNEGEELPEPDYGNRPGEVIITNQAKEREGLVLYDPETYDPNEIQALYRANKIDGIALPHYAGDADLALLQQCCRADKIVVCNNLGQMQALSGYGRLWAGIGMNAVNDQTVRRLYELGAEMVVRSVEAEGKLNHTIGVKSGCIPVMTFVDCPKKQAVGCQACLQKRLYDQKGNPMIFSCKQMTGRHSRLMGKLERREGQVVFRFYGENR